MFSTGFHPQEFHNLINDFAVPYSVFRHPASYRSRKHRKHERRAYERSPQAQYAIVPPSSLARTESHAKKIDPRIYLDQDESAYTITAEVPGFAKEQVSIEFADHKTLSVSGSTAPKQAESSPVQTSTHSTITPNAEIERPRTERSASPKRTSIEEVRDESETEYVEVDTLPATPGSPIFTESRPTSPRATSASTPVPSENVAQQLEDDLPVPTPLQSVTQHGLGVRTFEKLFEVPQDVDRDNISAELKDGLLRIRLAKLSSDIYRRTIRIA